MLEITSITKENHIQFIQQQKSLINIYRKTRSAKWQNQKSITSYNLKLRRYDLL